MKTSSIKFIILLILLCSLVKTVFAHDPGLSFIKIDVLDTEINLETSYSFADIKGLISNGEQSTIDQHDLNINQSTLSKLISSGINLYAGSKLIKAKTVDIFVRDNESVQANLIFEKSNKTEVSLIIPLIKQLPHGHRQHLIVNNGNQSQQSMLSAKSPSITINLNQANKLHVLGQYFNLGVWHIWIGFDHIVFLLTLLLPTVLIFRQGQWMGVEKLTPTLAIPLKLLQPLHWPTQSRLD